MFRKCKLIVLIIYQAICEQVSGRSDTLQGCARTHYFNYYLFFLIFYYCYYYLDETSKKGNKKNNRKLQVNKNHTENLDQSTYLRIGEAVFSRKLH